MSSAPPYLVTLAARLLSGCRLMEDDRRARHAAFVLLFQESDGGFRGRDGDSDLYYTAFAVRTLAMLDRLDADVADRLAAYLTTFDPQTLDVIDVMNWLASCVGLQLAGGPDVVGEHAGDIAETVAARLDTLRTPDGGFAKTPADATKPTGGSMYHSFLATLAYQLVGQAAPEQDRLLRFILDRQRDDGGFVEIAPMRRSGTNPTAAAAALLKILGKSNAVHPDDLRDFFQDVRTEAGLAANTRVPFPDGLSTFTGLLTDQDWRLGVLHGPAVRGFLTEQLEFPTGGYRAAAWDDAADIEYTFYGLGCWALTAAK